MLLLIPPQEVIDYIMEDFNDFVKDKDKLPDDLTVLVMKKL